MLDNGFAFKECGAFLSALLLSTQLEEARTAALQDADFKAFVTV